MVKFMGIENGAPQSSNQTGAEVLDENPTNGYWQPLLFQQAVTDQVTVTTTADGVFITPHPDQDSTLGKVSENDHPWSTD